MKQLYLILVSLFVLSSVALGQNTIYFDSLGNVVDAKEKADYYVVEINEGENTKNMTEYFVSGEKKAGYNMISVPVGNSTKWVMNGDYIELYPNGMTRKKIVYKNGRISNGISTYWPGGQLKRLESYGPNGTMMKCYNEDGEAVAYFPYYTESKFPGGKDSLNAFIKRNIKKELMADSIVKMLYVSFRVNKDGSLSQLNVKNSQNQVLILEAQRLVSTMPKWIPATEDGEKVASLASCSVSFGTIPQSDAYTLVEQMPGFKVNLDRYFSSHLVYPTEARMKKIEGTVVVRFVVGTKGEICNARVERGIGGGCDEEALRVVNGMPAWEPGRQGGKPVAVWFALPVRFVLN